MLLSGYPAGPPTSLKGRNALFQVDIIATRVLFQKIHSYYLKPFPGKYKARDPGYLHQGARFSHGSRGIFPPWGGLKIYLGELGFPVVFVIFIRG
jgi:hypothetical protein